MRLMRISRAFVVILMATLAVLTGGSVIVATPASASPSQFGFQLDPGDQLSSGESMWSDNDRFVASMGSDGNFYLAVSGSHSTISETVTFHPGSTLEMQYDGNLVIYAPGHIAVWESHTDGNPGTVLQVQDDGGLVLYAPGHQVLRVLSPQLIDLGNSVFTPRLTPASSAPPAVSGDGSGTNLVNQGIWTGTKVVGCNGFGKAVGDSSKVIPHGQTVSIGADKLCGAVIDGEVPVDDGFSLMTFGTSVFMGIKKWTAGGIAFDIYFSDIPNAN